MTQTSGEKISDLAKRVKHYMDRKGYSMAELERLAGVNKDVVRRLLGGHMQSTSPENVSKLAVALGITVHELLGLTAGLDIGPINVAPDAGEPKWMPVGTDDMEPTLRSKDYVMADMSIKEVVGSGLYVLEVKKDDFVIRRVARTAMGKGMFVSFDNKDKYPPEGEFPPSKIKIAGKVIGVYEPM